jgi:hypothetical protein
MQTARGLEVADIFRQHGPVYREFHKLPRDHLRVMGAIETCRTAALGGHKVMYDLLFRSVSETIMELANDPKHIGAKIGVIGILHTWGQNLMDHPHIHCIVTGGGLSSDGSRWISCRKGFFLPVTVMSALFSGKFLDCLKHCFKSGALVFDGAINHLKIPGNFNLFTKQLYEKKWVVYCKPPFDGPKGVLQYLGRYTHRVAISNNRILNIQGGKVAFRWRDYADDNRQKIMTLTTDEFVRRFLLHVLPKRYVRIRHFGLLANRNRKCNIAACHKMLGGRHVTKEKKRETWQEQLLRICGIDVMVCPICQKGKMCRVEHLLPLRCKSPPDLMR